ASLKAWGNQIGKDSKSIGLDETLLAQWDAVNARALTGEVVHNEWERNDAVMGSRSVREVVAPIYEGQEIRGVLGVNIDITERKRMDEALRESEDRFRRLAEASFEGICLTDEG